MTVRTMFVADQTLRGHRRRLRSEGEVRGDGNQSDATQLPIAGTRDHHRRLQQRASGRGRWRVEGRWRSHRRRAARRRRKAGVNREAHRAGDAETSRDAFRLRSQAQCRHPPDARWQTPALLNGAPGVLLDRCTHLYTSSGMRPLTPQDREQILAGPHHGAASAACPWLRVSRPG